MTTLLVSTKNAWRALGIGKTKGFELLRTRKLGAVRIGRKTLIPVAELERFAASLPRRNHEEDAA
jgi:excisionase family DNA binding protein